MKIGKHFADNERSRLAEIIWSGLGTKFEVFFGPSDRGIDYWAESLTPGLIHVARDAEDQIVGVSCARVADQGFVDESFPLLRRHYGVPGGLGRRLLLSFDDKVLPDRYLIDVLCVNPAERGGGYGSGLLEACFQQAQQLGKSNVALGVDAANEGARRLYERVGFEEIARKRMGPLKHVFKFEEMLTMERAV